MPAEVKNSISHRGRALESLKAYFTVNPPSEADSSREPEAKKLKEDGNDS